MPRCGLGKTQQQNRGAISEDCVQDTMPHFIGSMCDADAAALATELDPCIKLL